MIQIIGYSPHCHRYRPQDPQESSEVRAGNQPSTKQNQGQQKQNNFQRGGTATKSERKEHHRQPPIFPFHSIKTH